MGFFSSITRVFKKVAKVVLPVAAVVATGGAALGALGSWGAAGAAAAGASMAGSGALAASAVGAGASVLGASSFLGGAVSTIGRGISALNTFSGGPLGQTLKLGGQVANAFGNYQQASAAASTAGSNAEIAAMNAQELIALYDLNEKAYESEKTSITDAAAIRARENAEKSARADRSVEFGQQAITRDLANLNLSKKGIEDRQKSTDEIVSLSLDQIRRSAAMRRKEITDQQQNLIANAAAQAGTLGIRQTSDVITGSLERLQTEVDYTTKMLNITETYELERAGIQSAIQRSETEERLAGITSQVAANEQRSIEIEDAAVNADFDAALELEISNRNKDLALKRVESQQEGAKIRKETAEKTIAAQRQQFLDQQKAAEKSRIPGAISGFF
jgi:hypothetical protein|tara:strand:- start:7173 stop:8342 length:1170 start_codon:yes stop_codon:yes gene_type:complete